ncbi:MAG: DUF6458 family protein [Actinomycetota bacterium]|nr:DUF6458 family protein [Actinomycetota bacterium]
MGLGVSIFLIALGAILAFAVDYSVSGIDLATVGFILMVVGAIGLIASLILFAPRGGRTIVEDSYVDDDPGVVGRRRFTRRSDVI